MYTVHITDTVQCTIQSHIYRTASNVQQYIIFLPNHEQVHIAQMVTIEVGNRFRIFKQSNYEY